MSKLKRKSAFEELDMIDEGDIDFDVAYATSGDASASERQKIVDEVRRISVLADQAMRQAEASGDELDMSDAERWKQAAERWLAALNAKSTTHATKDMSTLMEVAKLLGQIGTAGAAMYVGAGAARETYDALKAKCREMMDKLDEAQRELDNIDPRELANEMRSDQEPREEKGDVIYGAFGSDSEGGDEGGEPGDVSDFFAQVVSEVEGTSTTLDNMYEAYVEWCQSRGYSPVPPEAFKREMLGMGIMRQYIAGRDRWLGVTLKSISVKAAGAHAHYR